MSRVGFTHASETIQASKGKPARSLHVNRPGDSFEAEADRVAETVLRGDKLRGQPASWSISELDMGHIQRDSIDVPAPTPASDPKPNNYGEGLGKLGEAFLKTDLGQQLTDAAKKQPITKDAEDFAESLPGKIIIGSAAVGAVSALAATHTPLPVQIPSIPLDSIKPGLSVKITYEGPVDHPTKATISFSYTPKSSSDDKKKTKQTATEKQRAENARMANDLYQFREGLKSPEQRKAEADDAQHALDSWMRRPNALTDGIDVNRYIGAASDKPAGLQLATPPLRAPYERRAPSLLDKKLELKPDPDEKKKEDTSVQRKAESPAAIVADSAEVNSVLRSSARPLDLATRQFMESRIGFDFSKVRIHADAQAASSAEALRAYAYTVGSDVVFGAGRYSPGTKEGKRLIAHELTHVVQQSGSDGSRLGTGKLASPASSRHEADADRTADSVVRGSRCFGISRISPNMLQRKMSMRDVGRGEHSGFARVPELIARLNAMSTGLVFALTGSELTYTLKAAGTLSNFDTQMQGFIDQAPVLPLRFTNRSGLTGNRVEGFNDRVQVDDYGSGYVDIDDLLASNDLGLQSALVHFLRERSSVSNYARRIGTDTLKGGDDTPEHIANQAEFDRAHGRGIQAELEVMRGFFNDPSIRLISGDDHGDVFRIFRNSRRDTIRTRVRQGRGAQTGVDAITVEVVTRDGKIHTPEEYKEILAAAAVAPAVAAPGGAARAATAPP